MKCIVTFCALCALWGCHQVAEPSGEVIALSYSTSEQSKTDALLQGDEVGVFACIAGTEQYFLEHAKYTVGSDGRTLTCGSTVYYPDRKDAVAFTAYLPFGGTWSGGVGTFSVPSDQSTAAALKQADLCWASARSTPAKSAVPLQFEHKLARLLITTPTPTTKLVAPNVFSGGRLDIKTGVFTNTTQATVSTTTTGSSTELILPAQTINRLIVTVSGVDYTFEGAIALEAAKTTTANLTLNPSTKTATLSGSSTTNWGSANTAGTSNHAVSNVLTLHWSNHLLQGTTPDQVVFAIDETDYTVSSGITYADQTFTVPFASAVLRYPYTITKIDFYQSGRLVQSCDNLLGGAVVKSGSCVVGVRQWPTVPNPPAAEDYVEINGLYWAKGNLVAVNQSNAKVGKPEDGGLYFQFGSLIGYKGGNQVNGGNGVGMPTAANGTFWNGATAWSWGNDAGVWPDKLSNQSAAWPKDQTTNQWYFGLQTDWSTPNQNIRDFPNFATGGLANVGVGDPCTYYLGGMWRQPTTHEYAALCNNVTDYSWETVDGSWTTSPVNGGNFSGDQLFFPASGYRDMLSGSFGRVATRGYGWSSSVRNATYGCLFFFDSSSVVPQGNTDRPTGFPVRCVRE